MYWMIEADKLDVEQRHFILEEVKSKENLWIKGFAGSGKSVLLVHAIVDKIRENPDAKICVVVFTHSLIAMFKQGLQDLNIQGDIKVVTYYKLYKDPSVYDYIYCDEVQDLTGRILKDMKSKSKQLIVAGDLNQSIFDQDPQFHEKIIGSNQIGEIIDSKAYELNTIYRLTKSIINAISTLVPEMNILRGKTDRTKEDVNINLCKGKNIEEEVEYILTKANEALNIRETSVIILPTHNEILKFIETVLRNNNHASWNVTYDSRGNFDYDNLNSYLVKCNLNIEYLGGGKGNLREDKIIIMTYHSAKGLDFDNVFLPFLSIHSRIRDKRVLMVGMTRSKKDLNLTYSGRKHRYMEIIKDKCTTLNIEELKNNIEDTFDF